MKGEMKETDLVAVIGSLYRSRSTGVLCVENDPREASVFVEKGRLVFSRSSNPDDRLGPYLLVQGKLRYEEFLAASARFDEQEKRLGTLLVEAGHITPDELYEAVVGQVKHIITRLFLWDTGQYRFQAGELPSEEVITLNIDTPTLLLDGVRQIDQWSRLERGVGPIGTVYHLQPEHEKVLGLLNLSPCEYDLLSFMKETCSLDTLLRESELSDIDTCRLIWVFRALGVVAPYRPHHETLPALQSSEEDSEDTSVARNVSSI